MHEEWFADEERVRKSAGLLEKPAVSLSRVIDVSSLLCYQKLIHFLAIITFICAAVYLWWPESIYILGRWCVGFALRTSFLMT